MQQKVEKHSGYDTRVSLVPRSINIVIGVAGFLSPFLFYYSLQHFGTRVSLLIVLLLLSKPLLHRFIIKDARLTRLFWVISLVVIGGLITAFYWNNELSVKLVPAGISFILFTVFLLSLWGEQSMIERFARLKEPELSGRQITHCRQFTVLWSLFFLFNGVLIIYTSLFFSLEIWLIITGPLSYCLIGLLLLLEFIIRKMRFS